MDDIIQIRNKHLGQFYRKKKMTSLRFVIIGGVAAGASAAARARRLSEEAIITMIERGPDVSFANCGLPYYIGGEIGDRAKLAIQTPESLERLLNIRIMTRTEVVKIHRERKVITVRSEKGEEEIPYDKLLLAPGAKPIRPPLKGIEDPRIMTLRNLQDMDNIKERIKARREILVIGAGFIGLEMVEMLKRLDKEVTLVELQPQVLPQMDPEMTKQIEVELAQKGVNLILGDGIQEFSSSPEKITAKLNSGKAISADAVILSIGIQCESDLAIQAGLELGQRKAIKVNSFQQTSDPDIYAAGDVVETADPILGKRVVVPLGGPANRQGRVAADHIFLGNKAFPYPGTIGTAIVRVFDIVAGVTGYTEKRLRQENLPYRQTIVTGYQHASYYPGAVPILLKILWNPQDGRLLGGEITGFDGIDKRLDVLSTAISGHLNIDDLCHLELAYAPPFGSARDVINIAGFAAQNIQSGLMETTFSLPETKDAQILDVRPLEVAKSNPVPGAVSIPLDQLRKRHSELSLEKPVTTVCALGKSSYFAARILTQKGFKARSLNGGWNLYSLKAIPSEKNSEGNNMIKAVELPTQVDAIKINTCGLSCPGPIMKIKESLGKLSEGQELVVEASDPGFAKDFPVYCQSVGLEFLGMETKKGIITARARKNTQATGTPIVTPNRNGATLVVFSYELDKVLAALVIANGAAAMGGKVTMFFTFWGLNVLRKSSKNDKKTILDKSFMDKMFAWMMPQGVDKLTLSHMNMGGMGTAMMKDRMKQKNLPNVPMLLSEALKNGVRLVACSMSMDAMGIKAEELIDGIEIGGVADFLAASQHTATNLFI